MFSGDLISDCAIMYSLLYDLKIDDKMNFAKGEYLLDINDNILFMYYDICINKLPPLSIRNDYIMVMNRLKSLSSITNDMIKIMEKGMQKKVYMNKLIIESFLDKCRSILDDKISPNNIPKDLKTKFIKSINVHIIGNINPGIESSEAIKQIYSFNPPQSSQLNETVERLFLNPSSLIQ